ncbi:MAG TPA: helix-turn-helix domain-containing protein [Candidatus Saccharimonadales bacterium]|nr:helix-turn-helix domain-containing protein [Candidatus Saccharimonadales bacterium]
MARLGEQLRQQRERMGLTLEQAAEDTRIREKFLVALENGDYQSLPGAVYTKGFLRNYAEYLNLDAGEQIALFQGERVAPEPQRTFDPLRPLVKRSFIFTPAVLVPIALLAGVGLFAAYVFYQFSNFAVPPRIEISDPASDTVAQSAEYLLKGRTVADGRVTVRVSPAQETINDIRPAADGSFSVTVSLKPGPNHIEVQVLDPAGKLNQASRTVQYNAVAVNDALAPQLIVEQPANGGTYTNAPVTVSGRVDKSVGSLLVNGAAVTVGPDGKFAVTVNFAQGSQTVRVVAKTATGGEVQETRTVVVSYTAAFVTVRITGGEAWILATVDGAQAPSTNKVFAPGQTLTFSGRSVVVRSGNGGVTFLSFNGQDLGKMGETGQVAERQFASP